jgi:hypothetical protein
MLVAGSGNWPAAAPGAVSVESRRSFQPDGCAYRFDCTGLVASTNPHPRLFILAQLNFVCTNRLKRTSNSLDHGTSHVVSLPIVAKCDENLPAASHKFFQPFVPYLLLIQDDRTALGR